MPTSNANDDFDDELLSAYVDDELTVEQRAQVEARLRTDPRAAQLVEELRLLSSAIKSLPRESLGRDLRASIQAEALKAKVDADARNVLPMIEHNRWAGYRRGLIWSAITIAAALMLMVFQPEESGREIGDVAQAERKDKAADGDIRGSEVATGDAALPPVGEMRAQKSPQEAASETDAFTATASVDESLEGTPGEDKSNVRASSRLAAPATVEFAMKTSDGLARFHRLLAEHNIQLESERAGPSDSATLAGGGDSGAEVLVEASPEQIDQLLDSCRSETETFAAVGTPQSLTMPRSSLGGAPSPAAEKEAAWSERPYGYASDGAGPSPGQSPKEKGQASKYQPSSGRAWRLPLQRLDGQLNEQSTLEKKSLDKLERSGRRAGSAGSEASTAGQVQVLFVFHSWAAQSAEPIPAAAAPKP